MIVLMMYCDITEREKGRFNPLTLKTVCGRSEIILFFLAKKGSMITMLNNI